LETNNAKRNLIMLEKSFDPASAEPRLYEAWEKSGAFQPRGEGEPFTIVIPPPNVTGSLHMGHALNNTLQDVLCRFQRMRGRSVLWQPGTDHAGIATQMVVERRMMERQEPKRTEIGREKSLEVESRKRRHDHFAVKASRRLLRLEPRTLHDG
jgi:valyl-tRNA synthetase